MKNVNISKGGKKICDCPKKDGACGGSIPAGGSIGSGGSIQSGGSIGSGGSINSGGSMQTVLKTQSHKVLEELQKHMAGRFHQGTKLPFGGALLAPHTSKTQLERVLKPALKTLKNAGAAAKDHPIANNLLNWQHRIIQKQPHLKNLILEKKANPAMPQPELPRNPFEHMNDQQLYHHVMGMPLPDWKKVQETAGVLTGKDPSRLGHNISLDQLQDLVRKHVPQLKNIVNTGGSLITEHKPEIFENILEQKSHLYDIAFSHGPHLAAQRLEVDPTGKFGGALKNTLWLSHVNDLQK